MKKTVLKNLSALLLMTLTTVGSSASTTNNTSGKSIATASIASNDVTLISRYTGGDYVSAGYSLRYLSQDVNLTRNNWEIFFEARQDFEDYFQVNTVVDDNSYIYDLGEKSCNDIKSSYPEDRKKRPLVWLAYSEASPSDLAPTRTAKVQIGHCYLTYNNDEDGRVVSLFHVKSHEKSKSVTIDEIEVLNVLNSK